MIRPLRFGGHSFWCRKCVSPDSVGGVYLTDRMRDYSLFLEVLAKGPRVGKPVLSSRHIKFHARPYCLPDSVQIGDLLFVPNNHRGIQRTTEQDAQHDRIDYEFFVEEHCAWAIYRDGQYIPVGNKVLAEPIQDAEIGGIAMPDRLNQRTRKARVCATGTGTISKAGEHIPPPTQEGDIVLIPNSYEGKPLGSLTGGNERFYLEEECVGMLTDEKEVAA